MAEISVSQQIDYPQPRACILDLNTLERAPPPRRLPHLPLPPVREAVDECRVVFNGIDPSCEIDDSGTHDAFDRLSSKCLDNWVAAAATARRLRDPRPIPDCQNHVAVMEGLEGIDGLARVVASLVAISRRPTWTIPHGNHAFCTEQCHSLFAHSRSPARDPFNGEYLGRDALTAHTDAAHVAVLTRGAIFKLTVVHRGDVLSAGQIAKAFKGMAETHLPVPGDAHAGGIAALTAVPRKQWADYRKMLTDDIRNKKTIEMVESSLFVVGIDDEVDAPPEVVAAYGSGLTRWFGHSLNVALLPTGPVVLLVEETACDVNALSLLSYTVQNDAPGLPLDDDREPPEIVLMRAAIPPAVQEMVENPPVAGLRQKKGYAEVACHDFGTRDLVNLGIDPEAFVQVVGCVAWHAFTKQPPSAYHSLDLGHFRYGRKLGSVHVTTPESHHLMTAYSRTDPTRYHTKHDVLLLLRRSCEVADELNKIARDHASGVDLLLALRDELDPEGGNGGVLASSTLDRLANPVYTACSTLPWGGKIFGTPPGPSKLHFTYSFVGLHGIRARIVWCCPSAEPFVGEFDKALDTFIRLLKKDVSSKGVKVPKATAGPLS
eukprot:Sspe_Gene.72088::Locus_42908_Transcript_1_1_Confidence_1.000_Length_1884::g.72088::m.72088/K08765/CPT1A; carnitine O-palmitoyltransferase 1, liver isoform